MKKIFAVFLVIAFIILILVAPNLCINGAQNGLIICGNVIIPSLFPFAVCVIFLMKTNIFSKIKIIKPVASKLFNQTEELFSVMIFSMIGGYPVGAKLLNELCFDNKISKRNAHIMQCYCVNAGPAFILVAVGSGILNSKKLGVILLISHLLSSIIIAFFCRKFIKYDTTSNKTKKTDFISLSDRFVESVAEAASSTLSICSFVILFSVINSYLLNISKTYKFFKILSSLCEVTTAVSSTKNIYIISFLLAFSGIAIWFQVMACSKHSGVNLWLFAFFRILHGTISTFLTFILLKTFKISTSTITNNIKTSYTFSDITVVFSLVIMIILFLISINSKKQGGNQLKDML